MHRPCGAANKHLCLFYPWPDYGGSGEFYSCSLEQFLLAARGSFSWSLAYGLYSYCPLSSCLKDHYLSTHCLYLMRLCDFDDYYLPFRAYKNALHPPIANLLGRTKSGNLIVICQALVVPPSCADALRRQPLWAFYAAPVARLREHPASSTFQSTD